MELDDLPSDYYDFILAFCEPNTTMTLTVEDGIVKVALYNKDEDKGFNQ